MNKKYQIIHGNNIEVLTKLIADGVQVDAIVTDPPYSLNNGKDTPHNILRILSNVVLPNLDKMKAETNNSSEFSSVGVPVSDLNFMNRSIGVESGVGVPESSVNFNCDIQTRKKKIKNGTEPTQRISNNVLGDESNIQGSQFLGDYFFDIRDAWNFASVNGHAGSFAELGSSSFSMPIGSILDSGLPNSLAGFCSVIPNDSIFLGDDSFSQSEGHASAFTYNRTVQNFVLRFDMRGFTIELLSASTARESKGFSKSFFPKLITASAATSSLSAEFQPCKVSCVFNSADGARSGYFHLWIRKDWHKSFNIYASGGFMGKSWDATVPSVEFWKLCLDLLKPGGHVLSFGSTRTYHRMVVNLEDAGFEIRDQIVYLFGTGFPKSLDISKAIDKAVGQERTDIIGVRTSPDGRDYTKEPQYVLPRNNAILGKDNRPRFLSQLITAPASAEALTWSGWGTALKPAMEPIVLARKPLSEDTIAENVLKHGTGGLNIDGCRIEGKPWTAHDATGLAETKYSTEGPCKIIHKEPHAIGRFPANLILDEETGLMLDEQTDGASRFFYCAKASKKERRGSKHPTVKPVALMRYLCRLITPPGGTILDPYAGTGATGEAAVLEGFVPILIEMEAEYVLDINRRMNDVNPSSANLDSLFEA